MADSTIKYISKITTPDGQTYRLRDSELRAYMSSTMHFIGITKTQLTDKAVTNRIDTDIKDADNSAKTLTYYAGTLTDAEKASTTKTYVKLQSGDVVIYAGTDGAISSGDTNASAPKEFIALVTDSGVTWSEIGSTGSLKALAFKDSAAVSQWSSAHNHSFTGTEAGHTHNFTGSSHNHTYDKATSISSGAVTEGTTANYTPAGSISGTAVTLNTATKYVAESATGGGSVSAGAVSITSQGDDHTHTVKTAGSWPTMTGSNSVAPSLTITDVQFNPGSLPKLESHSFNAGSLPTLTFALDTNDSENLKITWDQGKLPSHSTGTFTQGSLPTLKKKASAQSTDYDTDVTNIGSASDWLAGSASTLSYSTASAKFPVYNDHTHSGITATTTANVVTLPSFKSQTIATGVKSVTQGTFTGTGAVLSLGHTSTNTGSKTQGGTIGETKITPAGTIGETTITVSGQTAS